MQMWSPRWDRRCPRPPRKQWRNRSMTSKRSSTSLETAWPYASVARLRTEEPLTPQLCKAILMPGIKRTAAIGSTVRPPRGFVLPYVILVCVVILAFSGLLLASAQNLAKGMRSFDGKNGTFDAAEAGLNAALEALNISPSTAGAVSGSLANGYTYTYTIYTNFAGTTGKPISDPIRGKGLLNIPPQSALIVSVGSDPNGGRPSMVEALVAAHSG